MKEVRIKEIMTDELRQKLEILLHELGFSTDGKLTAIIWDEDDYGEEEEQYIYITWRKE